MRQLMSTEASNDPWARSPTTVRNEYTEVDLQDSKQEQRPRRRSRPSPRPSVWSCCYSGAGGQSRQTYSRARFQQILDEEHAYLMDSDDLELTWKNEDGESET